MIRPVTIVFFGMLLCAAGLAQQTAILTVPSIVTQVQQTETPAARVEEFVVTDKGDSPIVAMGFSFGCEKAKQFRVYDGLVFGNQRPIPPGGKSLTNILGYDLSRCPSGVTAAIFADGHAEGDPEKVANILQQRRGVYQGIAFVVPLLTAVVEEGKQPQALVTMSKERAQYQGKISSNIFRDQGYVFLLGAASETLAKEQEMMNPAETGLPYRPDIPNMDEVARSMKLDHTQAAAFVLRRTLVEWQKDLQGHLALPQSAS